MEYPSATDMAAMPGARLQPDGTCIFRVWAPEVASCLLVDEQTGKTLPMKRDDAGYWNVPVENVRHGFRYRYRLDGKRDRPDPASQWQPEGVHGPSAVVDHSTYPWADGHWSGLPLEKAIMYEIHTGTFSPEGTFEGIVSRLDHLVDLGITAVELMPVAHFPGTRNWGYDGVYPYAVHTAYGGIEGMKRLVDACHAKELAVLLDVVYNHLGPEGNYLRDYAPYFTENKYSTPWGAAINFDDAYSDDVRSYFIANALYWFDLFHIDGLRLDAVHAIFDFSARPFLEELSEKVGEFNAATGSRHFLIAESDLNDPRLIKPPKSGGMGLNAQWSDDLHHALHAALTGERAGYYQDFDSLQHVADALQYGYSYRGGYSTFRKRRFGRTPEGVDAAAFVVCSQNHDQVGNRMLGERLISLAGADGARLAAAVVLLSPMLPMLFMGEEWGEENPFLYFVDHGDQQLCAAVREGRKKEFSAFPGSGDVSDPTSSTTYDRSKIDWSLKLTEKGRSFFAYYRQLIDLRKIHPVLAEPTFEGGTVCEDPLTPGLFTWLRQRPSGTVFSIMNFGVVEAPVTLPEGTKWRQLIDSEDRQWGGCGKYGQVFAGEGVVMAAPKSFIACEAQPDGSERMGVP